MTSRVCTEGPEIAGGAGGGTSARAAAGVGTGVGAGVEVEASEGPRARALRDPGNVIVGSSGFQQFFRVYVKLMTGLRDSKVSESGTTPLAMHKAVISTGNLSPNELDWAIWEI